MLHGPDHVSGCSKTFIIHFLQEVYEMNTCRAGRSSTPVHPLSARFNLRTTGQI